MKYYHCSNCNNCFFAADTRKLKSCVFCRNTHKLRNIQRFEYKEWLQGIKDRQEYDLLQEQKHWNKCYDDVMRFYDDVDAN